MMKGRGDYAATAHSSMATFEPGRLSVPESVHDGPGLLALLPASEKERLESFLDKMLRSPEEVAQLEDELGRLVDIPIPSSTTDARIYASLLCCTRSGWSSS